MNKNMYQKNTELGFTLLITLLLMSVLLGVSSSLLNVLLKQYQLSDISESSEMAFQAANAGIECALYHDFKNFPLSDFDVDPTGSTLPEITIPCMGASSADLEPNNNTIVSGEEQRFRFDWGTPALCTEVSVYKFSTNAVGGADMSGPLGSAKTCPQNAVCTIIKSRGYNASCGNLTNSRTVERELIRVY